MGKLHHIDVAIIVSYLLFITVLGLFQAKKIKNIEQYTVGDRNFSTFAIVATMFATYISARATVGNIEKVHELGIYFAIPVLLNVFFWFFTGIFFTKNIDQFKGCLSIVDILQKLYGKPGLYMGCLTTVLVTLVVLSMQTTALAYLFYYFLGIPYFIGVIIGMGLVTLYSIFGGIRAVIITDIFQFLIFFFIFPIGCGYALYKIGGYNNLINSLPSTHTNLNLNSENTSMFLALCFYALIPAVGASYVQRLLIAKNKKQLFHSLIFVSLLAFIFASCTSLTGLIIKSQYPNIESKLSFSYFILNYLPVGLVGLMIVGLLAAIQSTADSWINTSSSIMVKNVISPIFQNLKQRHLLLIAKGVALIMVSVSVAISLASGEIIKLLWFMDNFILPINFIPLLAGFQNIRTNQTTFVFSVIIAMIGVVSGRIIVGEFGVISLIIGIIGSGLGFYIAHQYQIKKGIIEVSKNEVFKINLKQYISNAINNIIDIQHKIAFNKSLLYIIALLIMFVNIPILVFGYSSFTDMANIIAQLLRYATLLLSISLILHELLNINKNPILLWHLLLLLAFPLTSAYMLFMSDYTIIWGLNYFISVVGLFVLTNLYYAWILIIIGTSIAVILILACKLLLQSETILSIQMDNVFSPLYSSILLLIVLIFIIYSKFREEKIKQHSLEILGRSLAHDVSAPLTIGITISHLIRNALKNKKFELISDYVDNLEQCNAQAIQDIDIMLSSIKVDNNVKPKDWGTYSLNTCIIEALNNFQMTQDNKERVKYISKKEEDFKFTGSPTLVRHIIFNLLKNAFKYAGNEAKIEIYIKKNKLHIKDNGYGIENKIMKLLFQKNITTDGYGVGLNFCKQAMLKMHGDIICRSKKEFGAEFILSFSNRN